MLNIDKIEKLLKNELAAKETYRQALQKFEEEAQSNEISTLKPILQEHTEAVSELQQRLQGLGATPSSGSGLWGSWSEALMGGAKMIGKEAMLKALLAGEKSGLDDYQDAANDPDVPSEVTELIHGKFMNSQQENIKVLNRLLNS